MNQKLINFFALFFLLTTPLAKALSTDSEQPIYIDSDSQNLDLKNNTVVFSGNVFLRQGSIRLHADKVIVTRSTGKTSSEVINGYGKPANFEQTMDDGEKITGKAQELRYDVKKSLLTMYKEALLTQKNGNKIASQKITYNVEKQLLTAESQAGKRVTTVLQPQARK